jgi:hypothetical protein
MIETILKILGIFYVVTAFASLVCAAILGQLRGWLEVSSPSVMQLFAVALEFVKLWPALFLTTVDWMGIIAECVRAYI